MSKLHVKRVREAPPVARNAAPADVLADLLSALPPDEEHVNSDVPTPPRRCSAAMRRLLTHDARTSRLGGVVSRETQLHPYADRRVSRETRVGVERFCRVSRGTPHAPVRRTSRDSERGHHRRVRMGSP